MTVQSNLLFFMSDNHNRDVAGCYGHPLVKTPNIDRIAAAGVRFDNAYCASPLCCPSRAAVATGRFPHQTGYWDNALAYDGKIASWMHRLRDAGYDVVSVGKLHFRSGEDDNGFSEEILPMHILDGKGSVQTFLRAYDGERACTTGKRWELYFKRSGVGSTHYQEYDQDITRNAIAWLERNAKKSGRPWALFVSYISPHPPFTVPKRLYDLYPLDQMPLPPRFSPDERATHPAAEHHRRIMGTHEMTDENALRHVAASYFGLVTHVDEQIGQVMQGATALGALNNTRIVYTSDHGELFGAHGLLGKAIMYEGAIAVPLLMAGPDIPKGQTAGQLTSHVDLFPTLLESCGVPLAESDADLRGKSLWPALRGQQETRSCFAEFHANFSKSGAFMLRDGPMKFIYHVGMPAQLFNIAHDPEEANDLVADGTGVADAKTLEAKLRLICDPEETDARAKADQRAKAQYYGGPAKLADAETIIFTPPPGVSGAQAGAFDA